MKSSKTFGKAILAIVLSLVLMVSAVAPLTVMGSENNGGGLKGTSLGQYRYYAVRSGDTMESIANKNGITISDIMSFNGLDANSQLYKGQILKLPLTSKNHSNGFASSTITFKAKDASVKDVVSAIAANAGYTVIYKGSEQTVTIELENVTPLRAIDYVTRMVGLSYIKDGNTILVSTTTELNSTFVDSLVLSKFSFKYITYEELIEQANALSLNDMKVVSQSNNGRDVWISAYPKEMAKLHELCEILDVEGNVMLGSTASVANFTPIQMNYIAPEELSTLLASLGLHEGITMASHPMTLYVFATGDQLAEIMKIKKIVDTSDASLNNGTGSNSGSNSDSGSTIVAGNNTIVKIDLKNISRSDAEAIVSASDYASTIKTYGHDRMLKSIWLMGPSDDVNSAKSLIENYDDSVVSAASTIHTYEAQNCTVAELMKRIANVDMEDGVTFYEYDHPELTSMVICYCDDITWENEVLDVLVAADTVDTGTKMWIPIASKSGTDAANDTALLQNTIALMNELYPELFGGVSIRYETFVIEAPATDSESGETTGGSYKVVVYANTTSDAATRMQSYISAANEI